MVISLLITCDGALDPSQPTTVPRIYIYQLPAEFKKYIIDVHMGFFSNSLVQRVMNSPHYEPDGDRADYYWIPGEGGECIKWVKANHPWWNRTMERGEARWVHGSWYGLIYMVGTMHEVPRFQSEFVFLAVILTFFLETNGKN